MARVDISQECVEIRVSFFERLLLGERPRRLALSRIRDVDAHPRLSDMMVHWLSRHALWLSGVSPYEGQMIPSTRNPSQTLALTLEDASERVYVELDDESTDEVAARIRQAIRDSVAPPPPSATPGQPPAGSGGEELVALPSVPGPSQLEARRGDSMATGLLALSALTLTAGIVAWATSSAPSPLLLAAGAAAAIVTGVGYAVFGR